MNFTKDFGRKFELVCVFIFHELSVNYETGSLMLIVLIYLVIFLDKNEVVEC